MNSQRLLPSLIQSLYVVLILDLIATAVFAYQSIDTQIVMDRSHKIIEELNGTSSTFQRIESAVRGYVNTGNRTILRPYFRAGLLMDAHENELTALLSNSSDQQPLQLSELKETIKQKLEWQEQVILAYEQGGREFSANLSRTNRVKRR
jgi:CHASE3 domain sensor protein